MDKPIRIIQCIPGSMAIGGLETLVMNLYRNIDKTKVQFDFIIHGDGPNDFKDEIKKLGGKVYRLPNIKKYNKYKKQLTKILNENKGIYHLMHIHAAYASVYFDAKIAKESGINKIIVHSHSSNSEMVKRKIFTLLFKRKLAKITDYKFGCSKDSIKWLFGNKAVKEKDYKIINNAIDTEKYKFNESIRKEIRKELDLTNKFVIGHVGRLAKVKNHEFLLKVFKKVLEKEKNSVLLLVGKGEEQSNLINQAKELGINDSIKFLGDRDDINRILQAMDMFVFPSLYEGFSIALLEAQTSGLKCFVSESVDKRSKLTEQLEFVSLNKTPEEWADQILNSKTYDRKDISLEIKNKKYDIIDLTKDIQEFYLNNSI